MSLSAHRLFVRGSNRFEVAGLKYFQHAEKGANQAASLDELTSYVDATIENLYQCTSKLPARDSAKQPIAAGAEDISLLPKYGSQQKTEPQKAADASFLTTIDQTYSGNREKAAADLASKGWELMRSGDATNAMRRFNQSWLTSSNNGNALWGMAVIQARTGKPSEAMKLFAEAESTLGDDLDFSTDYAKAVGVTGVATKDPALVGDSYKRFSRIYEKAPQHTANLQNWAITLYMTGNYAEAWKKIQLAEATSRASELDPRFIAALKAKLN